MDFGVFGLEGLVGSQVSSKDSEAESRSKGLGSVLIKDERSGFEENDLRSSKMAKVDNVPFAKAIASGPNTPVMRSSSLLPFDQASQQEQMMSFSSLKSKVPFFAKDLRHEGGSNENQSSALSYNQCTAFRSSGYGSGTSNPNLHVPLAEGKGGPFTPSQWIELEHQTLVYKYITSDIPVPSNLPNPLKTSICPYGLSSSSGSSLAPNTFVWGSFHLGFSGSIDPEPGRCRRTDGKKWRCSRDAVADQKYCERHINRGRHRSRKPVEGHTGHASFEAANSKVGAMNSSMSLSVMPGGCISDGLTYAHHHFNSMQSDAPANLSSDTIINRENGSGRVQITQDPNMLSPSINFKSNDDSCYTGLKQGSAGGPSQPGFGVVVADHLLNPSHQSSFVYGKNHFLEYDDQQNQEQQPLHQFIDNLPENQLNHFWHNELKSDWTQLSMSPPMTSTLPSSASSTVKEKLDQSPARLSREFDSGQVNINRASSGSNESTQKHANWVPVSWGTSMGGPLGEVLSRTTKTAAKTCKNSSVAINLLAERWDGSSQLDSSPTGVLQKTTFGTLSSSSSGSSPGAEKKAAYEAASLYEDMLGSTPATSFIHSSNQEPTRKIKWV